MIPDVAVWLCGTDEARRGESTVLVRVREGRGGGEGRVPYRS